MSQRIFRLLTSILILSMLVTLPTQPARAGGNGPDSLPGSPNWTGQSGTLGAHFGMKIAPAGDVNGDGYQDMLASAPDFDGWGGTDSGRAYLYLGSATGIPQYPAAMPSWWVDGDQAGAKLGSNVAGIGDVNHDGYDDIAISAYLYDSGETDEGKVFVWYGGPGANPLPCLIYDPPDYCASAADAPWMGESNQANAQLSYIAGGDVNGDHYSDLVVGAFQYDNGTLADTGAVFVWLGAPNSLGGLNFGDPGIPGLAFWKAYGDQADAEIGYRVAAVDVKHDGQADIIASSVTYANGSAGEGAAFAWYAPFTGDGSPANANWKVESNQVGAHLGQALDTAGDVNGDNAPDLIVSAPYYSNGPAGVVSEGMVFVFHGSASGLPGSGVPGAWQDVYAAANWIAESNHNNGLLGYTAAGPAGDVNTDGYDDVIFGEPYYSITGHWRGKVYVFYGSSSGLSCGAGCPVDAGNANWGMAGDQDGEQLGYSAAGVGDVNGDHVSDVFVGAPYYNNAVLPPPEEHDGGKAFGYYGISENTPPVAVDDLAAPMYEDEVYVSDVSVLANDYDPGGNPNRLWAEFIIPPPPPNTVHGSVSMTRDGFFTYTPDANWNGEAIFDYAVWDGYTYDVGQVRIPVSPVNDPPSFTQGGNPTVNEDAGAQTISNWATNISAGPADEAGQTLNFVITGNSNPGLFAVAPAVNATNGTLTFTPAANANGSSAITLVLHDNGGTSSGGQDTSAAQSFIISVTPVNDPPVAANDSYSVNEDTTLTVSAPGVLSNDSDIEGSPLTAVLDANPAHGTLTLNANGSLTYLPSANYSGTDSFTYHARDGAANSNTATVSITINPANDPPSAVDDAASTAQDTSRTIAVLGNDSDPDGDTLSISAVTDPPHGSVVNNGSNVTYTPDAGYTGTDTFNYTCSDGHGGTDTAQVTVDVGNVNDPPVAAGDSATTTEDASIAISVLANDSDPDGDTLSIVSVTQPAHGSVIIEGTTVRYTPAANYHGSDSFTYRASDGQAQSNVATVSLTITPVNDVPVAVDDDASTDEDTDTLIAVLSNDSDGDGEPLSIVSLTQPAHGTAIIEGTAVRYTPAANYHGPDSFTYKASDDQAQSSAATVNITINPVNDPPTAGDDSAGTTLNTPATIAALFNDADVDGDALSISEVSLPGHGTAAINGTNILYTPASGYSGADTFTYTVSDGQGGSDSATVNITIRATNTPPVAVDDDATTPQNAPVMIAVLENDSDADNDPLSITQVGTPAHGTAVINGTQVIYTPAPGYRGSDTFTYTISDGFVTATATVTVEVTPISSAYQIFLPLLVR